MVWVVFWDCFLCWRNWLCGLLCFIVCWVLDCMLVCWCVWVVYGFWLLVCWFLLMDWWWICVLIWICVCDWYGGLGCGVVWWLGCWIVLYVLLRVGLWLGLVGGLGCCCLWNCVFILYWWSWSWWFLCSCVWLVCDGCCGLIVVFCGLCVFCLLWLVVGLGFF